MPLEIDYHEPQEIQRLIDQATTIDVKPLNDEGFADYRWDGVDYKRQVERKTWHDLISGLDSVEDLLRRQMKVHPEWRLTLLIEGVVEPSVAGILSYRKNPGRNMMLGGSEGRRGQYKELYSWLNQVSRFLDLMPTATMAGSAASLHAMYDNDQKTDHNTFQRPLKILQWNPNLQVARLMNVALNDCGIGPATAEALIKDFGTVWAVLSASPKELAQTKGMGLESAKTLLRKVGRLDV